VRDTFAGSATGSSIFYSSEQVTDYKPLREKVQTLYRVAAKNVAQKWSGEHARTAASILIEFARMSEAVDEEKGLAGENDAEVTEKRANLESLRKYGVAVCKEVDKRWDEVREEFDKREQQEEKDKVEKDKRSKSFWQWSQFGTGRTTPSPDDTAKQILRGEKPTVVGSTMLVYPKIAEKQDENFQELLSKTRTKSSLSNSKDEEAGRGPPPGEISAASSFVDDEEIPASKSSMSAAPPTSVHQP